MGTRPSLPAPAPAVALCLCLLLAGCGASFVSPTATPTGDASPPSPGGPATAGATPTATATPTPTASATPTATPAPTPAPQGSIPVRDGNGSEATLPVNATLVYERTARLLATDTRPPDVVRVRAVEDRASRSPPPFFRLWGLTRPAGDAALGIAAFVPAGDRVVVNREISDRPAYLEGVLAHEYVHVVQFRLGAFRAVRGPGSGSGGGPDARATATAVTEGAAVLTADVYWRQYQAGGPRAGTRPAVDIRRLYRNSTGIDRWTAAPYRFGYRYVRERAGDPAALVDVYEDPPTTTEQVLHPGVEEDPVRLATRASGTEGWIHAEGDARMGELFVRTALGTELPPARAAAAAEGWGNDVRATFVNRTGARGFAWTVRFDDDADATAFAGALDAYLDARGATRRGRARVADGRAFRAVRVDDRTVVVLGGEPYFTREASVRTASGTVIVDAPEGR